MTVENTGICAAVTFEMSLAQEEKIVLQADGNRFVMGERLDDGEGAVDGIVQRRVGAPVQSGHLDQDADLGDQLGSQHQDLLVVDVAGLRTFGDLLGQRLFVGQDRLWPVRCWVTCAMDQP